LTAATQWFERTLDDSANRRIAIPEAFLAADAIALLYDNIVSGVVVHEDVIAANVRRELPFLMTENLMMEGVRRGGDRQVLHERVRIHSQAAADSLKSGATENDLFDRIAGDALFAIDRKSIAKLAHPRTTPASHASRPNASSSKTSIRSSRITPPTSSPVMRCACEPNWRSARCASLVGCATTVVQPKSSEPMNGTASWYGQEFAGRTTANGEIFDPMQLTAAHRTLPFGTVLDVRNARSGQVVRVRVNDRGPYINDRVIDLSYAAALQIGLIEPGSGPVELAVVKLGRGDREPPAPYVVTVPEVKASSAGWRAAGLDPCRRRCRRNEEAGFTGRQESD